MKDNKEKKAKIVIREEYYDTIRHMSCLQIVEKLLQLAPCDKQDDKPKLITWNRYLSGLPQYKDVFYTEEDSKILIKAIPEKGTGFGKIIKLSNGSRCIILEYRDDETVYVVVPEEKFEVATTEEILAAHC